MDTEQSFIDLIRRKPRDRYATLVYADWLEERGDARADILRLQLLLSFLPPDFHQRIELEQRLSLLKTYADKDWLKSLRNEPRQIYEDAVQTPCKCIDPPLGSRHQNEFHCDVQDTECDAWRKLLGLIERAADDHRHEFAPLQDLAPHERRQIVTLPPTISNLKAVRHLSLYGSNLVRIPPEIGEMTSLNKFTPYTSYRLHWLPYEITRCTKLKDSTVSTRALYGNFKTRLDFPKLLPWTESASDLAIHLRRYLEGHTIVRNCSVCDEPYEDNQRYRAWISLNVATDVMPLLVNACSKACIGKLPTPPTIVDSQTHLYER